MKDDTIKSKIVLRYSFVNDSKRKDRNLYRRLLTCSKNHRVSLDALGVDSVLKGTHCAQFFSFSVVVTVRADGRQHEDRSVFRFGQFGTVVLGERILDVGCFSTKERRCSLHPYVSHREEA